MAMNKLKTKNSDMLYWEHNLLDMWRKVRIKKYMFVGKEGSNEQQGNIWGGGEIGRKRG